MAEITILYAIQQPDNVVVGVFRNQSKVQFAADKFYFENNNEPMPSTEWNNLIKFGKNETFIKETYEINKYLL